MTDSVSDSERVTGRAGVQQARARLDVKFPIRWDREAKVYRAGGLEFPTWHLASVWVLEQTEGEQ